MYNLMIDTSSKNCSFAVSVSEAPLGYVRSNINSAENGVQLLLDMFKNLDITLQDIEIVSIVIGPGSLTGIKIGISIVSSLKLINPNINIVTINVTDAIYYIVNKQVEEYDFIINLTEISQVKCYIEIVDKTNNQIIAPKILEFHEINDYLLSLTEEIFNFNDGIKIISGFGANKHFQDLMNLKLNNFMAVLPYTIDAKKMIKPTRAKIKDKCFIDISELNPVLSGNFS